MELLYSTGDIDDANRFDATLAAIGIPNFISGALSADLHGFHAGRTPASISDWIHNSEDLGQAINFMLRLGYILPYPDQPRSRLKHNRVIVVILVMVFIPIIGIAMVSGP